MCVYVFWLIVHVESSKVWCWLGVHDIRTYWNWVSIVILFVLGEGKLFTIVFLICLPSNYILECLHNLEILSSHGKKTKYTYVVYCIRIYRMMTQHLFKHHHHPKVAPHIRVCNVFFANFVNKNGAHQPSPLRTTLTFKYQPFKTMKRMHSKGA